MARDTEVWVVAALANNEGKTHHYDSSGKTKNVSTRPLVIKISAKKSDNLRCASENKNAVKRGGATKGKTSGARSVNVGTYFLFDAKTKKKNDLQDGRN